MQKAHIRRVNNVRFRVRFQSVDAPTIVDDIGQFQERGLQHFLIGGDGSDYQGTADRLELFATEVMAKFQ